MKTRTHLAWIVFALASVVGCSGGGGGGGSAAPTAAAPAGGTVVSNAPSAPAPNPASATPDASAQAPGTSGGGATSSGGGATSSGGGSTSSSGSTPAPASSPADPPSLPGPASSALDYKRPMMGINLNEVSYYSPEWTFVDVFRSSRSGTGFPWGVDGGGQPALRADGYPAGLAAGQSVWTLCMRAIGGAYPGGTYTVFFEGKGEVQLDFDAERTSLEHDGVGEARFTADVTPSDSGIMVRILASDPANPVRNLRVIMPGFVDTYATQPFHPRFLERLQPFAVLRFMDWGATNNSELARWSERTLPQHRTQHGHGGVAFELMAQLCNTLDKDAWVCVPHKAEPAFVRELARLLGAQLKPGLKVFVEYSNEVWNGLFRQHQDVKAWGSAAGQTLYEAYAGKALEVFRAFTSELGSARVVRVVASQSANPWISEQILNAIPAGEADALAIAPYFGGLLGTSANVAATRAMTVEQVVDALVAEVDHRGGQIAGHRAAADAAGVALIAYEGGQHLVGVGASVDDDQLTALFQAANRHPRMEAAYRAHLEEWTRRGGGLFCSFNFVYRPQKWGSWGLLEAQDQDLASAPKYRAVRDLADLWRLSQ